VELNYSGKFYVLTHQCGVKHVHVFFSSLAHFFLSASDLHRSGLVVCAITTGDKLAVSVVT